ncbi:MAG: hypothetical protein MJ078_02550 [Clostridia bacterium]|nr:hypothetical protein [Clostridia bacterium]
MIYYSPLTNDFYCAMICAYGKKEVFMRYVYLLLYALLGCSVPVINKNYQKKAPKGTVSLWVYLLINSVMGLLFYYLPIRGKMVFTPMMFVYSVVFSLASVLCLTVPIWGYSVQNIAVVMVFRNAGGIVVTAVFGVFFFHERVSLLFFLSILFVLIAIALPLFSVSGVKRGFKAFLPCFCIFFVDSFVCLTLKYYQMDASLPEITNMYFWTNAVMFAALWIFLPIYLAGHKEEAVLPILKQYKPKLILSVVLYTVVSVSESLFLAFLIKLFDREFTLVTVVNFSLNMLGTLLVARFVFKEKLSLQNILAAFFVCLSLVFSTLHSALGL